MKAFHLKFNDLIPVALVLGIVVVLLHLATFNRPQLEGDELVYLNLSNKISLTMKNYHTVDVPGVNEFPAKIYRAPYFIHPPLFPMLLKAFSYLGNRAILGLTFNAFVHFACCLLVLFGAFQITSDLKYASFGAILTAICPVMTAATIKLHIDALSGVLCLATFLSFFYISMTKTQRLWFVPAVLFGLSLNTKLTILALFPAYFYAIYIFIYNSKSEKKVSYIYLLGSIITPVLMISPHLLCLLTNYGSLFPYQLLAHDRPDNEFLKHILARTRIHGLINLISLTPLALLLFVPSFYKDFWKGFENFSAINTRSSLLFLLNLVVPVFVIFYGTERYWALFLPFFYFVVSIYFFEKKALRHKSVLCAVCLIIFLMICSSFFQGVVSPQSDLVYPSIFMMIPRLMPYYL